MRSSHGIRLKNANEVDILRKAGKILSSIVVQLQSSLSSGITTKDLDLQAEELIRKNGVIAAFKGYRGFPGVACISVNEGVVHGIPDKRVIKVERPGSGDVTRSQLRDIPGADAENQFLHNGCHF